MSSIALAPAEAPTQQDLGGLLAVAEDALRQVAAVPLASVSRDGELVGVMQRLEALGRRCEGQKLAVVAEIGRRHAHSSGFRRHRSAKAKQRSRLATKSLRTQDDRTLRRSGLSSRRGPRLGSER